MDNDIEKKLKSLPNDELALYALVTNIIIRVIDVIGISLIIVALSYATLIVGILVGVSVYFLSNIQCAVRAARNHVKLVLSARKINS
jgi:hypothetical protein